MKGDASSQGRLDQREGDPSVSLLQLRRKAIRQGLARANLAAAFIIGLVIVLAIGAMVGAYRAEENAQLAEQAAREVKRELWKSYLAQARASRTSGVVGRRVDGLAAVAAAAKIRPAIELRNEAIGLLALADLQEDKFWGVSSLAYGFEMDADLERYVWRDRQGVCHVNRFSDNQALMELPGPNSTVGFTQFSPDGQLLAARYQDDQLWIWELSQQKPIVRLRLDKSNSEGVFALAFSPDSRLVAVGEFQAQRVRLFDARTGAEIKRFQAGGVEIIDFHPLESKCAVIARHGAGVQIFDWEKEKLLETKKHTTPLTNTRWSQDGAWLAAGSVDGGIVLWDLMHQRTKVLAGHTGISGVTDFDPLGRLVVSRSWDGTSRFWETGSGRQVLSTYGGFAGRFSRDGKRLGFVRDGSGAGCWRVFASPSFQSLHVPGGRSAVFSAQVSPDGHFVVASKSDGVHVLELSSGREIQHLPLPDQWVQTVAFPPGGKTLVSSGAEGFSYWPVSLGLSNGQPRIQFGPRRLLPKPQGAGEFSSAKFTADGQHALIQLNFSHAALADLETGQYGPFFTNQAPLAGLAISPDKRWVVTSTQSDTPARIWNARTGQIVQEFGLGPLGVNFSPDGRWLVTSGGNETAIRDVNTWQPRHRFARQLATGSPCQPFSPDSQLLAFADSRQVIKLAATETGELMAECRAPHEVNIGAIEFSADGRHLLACTGNDEVLVWDLPALRGELAALGLDWPRPGAPRVEGVENQLATAYRRFGLGGFNQLVLVTVFGVAASIGFALLVFHRHRGLIRSYAEIEALAEQRMHDLERAQTEILHSQKMKALGTLAAGIAHDFNNLLSVVRMSNELIEEAKTKAEVAENTAEIEQAVQQGKTIVQSMLGYSRQAAECSERYSVAEITKDLLALLSKQFLSGLALKLDANPETPPVVGDPNRVEQILLNLIVNAAESMKGAGELRIGVGPLHEHPASYVLRPKPAEKYVDLVVSDTGPGIAPEVLARVFEPFFSTKHSGATPGTGLGLSMVYRIAEADGFGIAVDSSSGAGAAFRIVIPAEDRSADSLSASSLEVEAEKPQINTDGHRY